MVIRISVGEEVKNLTYSLNAFAASSGIDASLLSIFIWLGSCETGFVSTVLFNTQFPYILYITFVSHDLLSAAVGLIVHIELGASIYNILSNNELHKHTPTVGERTVELG